MIIDIFPNVSEKFLRVVKFSHDSASFFSEQTIDTWFMTKNVLLSKNILQRCHSLRPPAVHQISNLLCCLVVPQNKAKLDTKSFITTPIVIMNNTGMSNWAYFWMGNNKSNKYGNAANNNVFILPHCAVKTDHKYTFLESFSIKCLETWLQTFYTSHFEWKMSTMFHLFHPSCILPLNSIIKMTRVS